MSATAERIKPEDLAELGRLSRAQLQAAKAGNPKEVRLLLGTRRQLLAHLKDRVVSPERLKEVFAPDAETIATLKAEMERVEESLLRLSEGGRALQGYVVRMAASPGFVDQMR
jgi:hypothetical protein